MVEEKCKRCFIKDVEYKCRTCFEPSGVIHELDWVFEDFSKEIVKLKNYSDDRLPNTMCSCCLDKLNISVTFITQIKVINEKYLKLLNESDITLDENGLKQADLNADCLEEHTIDMPVDHLCVQQIKLEEADEFNLAKITTTPEIYSEGNVIETEGTTRSDILKSDVPQRKLSADIPIYGSLKKEILKAQPQESSEDDDNSKYDENWEGHESSSDEETLSVTKKKIKLEKKSSAKNTKRNVELPPSNNKFDNIKKVNGRFVCLLCEKSFSDRKVCVRHISSIHLKENTFSCEFCGNNFHRKDNLTEHVKRMHSADSSMREQQSGGYSQTFKSSSAKIIQCGLCCKSFETLQLLRLHLPIHADGRTDIDLTNSIYIKRFEKSKNMDLTLLQHQIQSNFKRQQISRYYRALDKDGNEMDILDSETEDDDDAALGKTMVKYQCTLCTTPADFKRRKNLMAHQHENHSTAPLPFKCDDCAKEFISNCLLQQHMQRECADEFRKQARQCEHCEKRFIWPNNMTRHKEIQHKQQRQQRPQNTSNTLKCDFCDKTFLWPKDLARHRKIHVDGKKFSCPHCERKFQRKDNLKSHLRLVHDSQLIPDNTTAINKSNRTTDQILPHLVKPHGCKIIKCMICYTEFNKICDLRSHLKSHQVEIDLSRRMQGNEKISEISQQLYPEELPILAVEELQKKILHDIACNNNIERFYSITNEHGYEIHLDSSETESDSEEETELNEIEKINCKRFYNCDNCTDVSFTRKYQLFDHQQKMHSWEDASHSCVHCNARFLSSYLLQLHYKRQCKNSIKKFFCKQCPLRFMWKNNLVAHTTMDHAINLKKESHPNIDSSTELHYCLLCPITFYNNQHLNKHLLEIHHLTESDIKRVETLLHSSCWPNEEKKIECKLCLMKFQTMHELRQHQSISLNSNSICHAVEHSVRNYSIVNKKGFELNLELDSETDNDDDQEDDIEQHQTETMNSDLCSSKPYLCALCNWSSKRKYQMMQHQRSHHDYNETLQWKCENCLFSSVCERILDYHKRTQCFNLDKEFQCHHCNIKFMWPENLESHVLVFHAPSNCSKTDTLNIASEIQLSPTTNNIFECMDCHKQYNSIIRYRAHFQKFHNPNNKTTLSHKQRKSQTKQAAIHSISSKKNIEKNSLCPFCGVSFSNNSKFVIHLRRHTGEKPYKCDLCEKGFPRSTDLQAHRRSHTGEKPYKCSSCDKSFSQHNKLRIHNRTHTGERPYHCTFCEKTFKQSSVLTLHLRRHTGETPYVCGTCGKGYVCSAALKKHQNSKGHLAAEAHNGDAVVNITDYQSNLDCEYSSQY